MGIGIPTAHYKNVASSGIKYKIAYIMADIELVGLQYSLEEMRPVSLCNSVNAQSSNQYDCPGDGTYGFTLEYPIPNIGGTEKTSWLASGFGGTLSLKIYAEMDERMMVGLCYYNLETYVTQNPDSRFETPSAATVAGAVMGVIAVGVIIAVFYSCRRIRLRKKRIKTDKLLEHLTKDDITTIWKRLDDETRSIQSVFSKDADSSLASSPSLKFRPPTPTASKAGPTAEEATGDAEDPAPPKEGAEEPDRTPMWITAPDIKPESSKKKHRKKPQSDRSYPDEMAL